MPAAARLTIAASLIVLTACGRTAPAPNEAVERQRANVGVFQTAEGGSILDFFRETDESSKINVNKHLWAASLDVLSFLPLEAVDPFSGVITTGWGRVDGASQAYRSTVFISGPALEARSLRVAVFRNAGGRAVPVDTEVAEQIEDAILTRARQLNRAEEFR
ncbi:MAG: DUF3576 domain-containing protein [Pseudomonadota bacterium]